jgi:uroporphyrinogen-III synthase
MPKPNVASLLLALPQHKIKPFSKLLASNDLSLDVFEFPVLELTPGNVSLLDYQFADFDWLILASSFAATVFFEALREQEKSLSNNLKIAVVGPSVFEVVENYGYSVALQPQKFNAVALIEELLQDNNIAQKKCLFVCGEKTAADESINKLKQVGASISKLIVYKSELVLHPSFGELQHFLQSEASVNIICLTSPEGVQAFSEILSSQKIMLPVDCVFVCLGPATQNITQSLFLQAQVYSPAEYSYNGMIQLIKDLVHNV